MANRELHAHSASKFRAAACVAFLLLGSRGAPSIHAQTGDTQQNPAPTIRLEANRVLVPVIVRDKAGHLVTGLTKDDFQVLDEGKPHAISALTVLQHTSAAASATPQPGTAQPAQPHPQRFVVFLVDDLHMEFSDLKNLQKAATGVLKDSLDPSDFATVVSLSGKTSTSLTRDRAKLLAGFNGIQIQRRFQHSNTDCPNISYYQAVKIERDRMADSPEFQDAMAQAAGCNLGIDEQQVENVVRLAVRQVLATARHDVFSSYATIWSVIHTMSTLPGERRLILISPGFLSIEPEAFAAESRVVNMALESNVTISALDARGLFVSQVGSNEQVLWSNARGDTRGQQNDIFTSELFQASSSMAALSAGTGGTFFQNSNDLQKGFRELTEIPETEYVLELAPDGLKKDGTFHSLKVKVHREDVTVQARRGYVVPKPEKSRNTAVQTPQSTGSH